jgi:hypothetical protein
MKWPFSNQPRRYRIVLTGRIIVENYPVNAIVAIITGILILIVPRLLNYIVALYLILTGILTLIRL